MQNDGLRDGFSQSLVPDGDERHPGDAVQVLQDSLCGSSKVMLVCNLSPEAASATETLSSLNFASRAAQVTPPLSPPLPSIPSSECFCGPVCSPRAQSASAECNELHRRVVMTPWPC